MQLLKISQDSYQPASQPTSIAFPKEQQNTDVRLAKRCKVHVNTAFFLLKIDGFYESADSLVYFCFPCPIPSLGFLGLDLHGTGFTNKIN